MTGERVFTRQTFARLALWNNKWNLLNNDDFRECYKLKDFLKDSTSAPISELELRKWLFNFTSSVAKYYYKNPKTDAVKEFYNSLPDEVKNLAQEVAEEVYNTTLRENRLEKAAKYLAIGGILSISASAIALCFDKARHWAGENLDIYLAVDGVLLLTTCILMYRMASFEKCCGGYIYAESVDSSADEIEGHYRDPSVMEKSK